jgi:hypothetical protein
LEPAAVFVGEGGGEEDAVGAAREDIVRMGQTVGWYTYVGR